MSIRDFCHRLLYSFCRHYKLYRMIYDRKAFAKRDFIQKKGNITPLTNSQKREIIAFWKPICNIEKELHWFEFYNTFCEDKEQLKYYIPDSIYYSAIDRFYSNPDRSAQIDDKNLYDLIFYDIKRPHTIVHKTGGLITNSNYQVISPEQALELCKSHESVIAKKAVASDGGKGITFFDFNNITDQEFIEWLKNNDEITIQEIIRQHPALSSSHANSINTIRIMTLMLNRELHVLSSVLRMGVNGARVDNASSGGIVCGIDKNGCLKEYAYNIKGERWSQHPQGAIFKGTEVIGYHQCVELSKRLAGRINGVSRLISWDFAIGLQGEPILIEVNLSYGQVDFHQICNGPILSQLTNEQRELVLRCALDSNAHLRGAISRFFRRKQ